MKKNNTQFTTKQEKKLRRKLKFYIWILKTFTKENILAALCGITAGISLPLILTSFLHYNWLGFFGFLFSYFWAIGTWTAFVYEEDIKKSFTVPDEKLKKVEKIIDEGL